MIRRFLLPCIFLTLVGLAPLSAQRAYLMFSGGQMGYDGGGSRWFPAVTVGFGIPVTARVRMGILGTHASFSSDPDEVTFYAPTSVSRALAFGEWDAVTLGAHGPAVYLRGGIGYVHTSANEPTQFVDDRPRFIDDRSTNGMAAALGLGVRVPVVSRIAINGGLDFHDDQIMTNTTGLRDWAWSVGIAVTP